MLSLGARARVSLPKDAEDKKARLGRLQASYLKLLARKNRGMKPRLFVGAGLPYAKRAALETKRSRCARKAAAEDGSYAKVAELEGTLFSEVLLGVVAVLVDRERGDAGQDNRHA